MKTKEYMEARKQKILALRQRRISLGDKVCHVCGGDGRYGECDSCKGKGSVPCAACDCTGVDYDLDPPGKCKVCGGTGRKTCVACDGTGEKECYYCNATGEEPVHGCNDEVEEACIECKRRQEGDVEMEVQENVKTEGLLGQAKGGCVAGLTKEIGSLNVAVKRIDAGDAAYLEAHKEYLSCKKSKSTLANAVIEKYEEAISVGNCNAINEFAEILSEDKGRLPNGCFGDDVELMGLCAMELSELSSKVSGLSFVQRKKESEETAKRLIEARKAFRSSGPNTKKEESPSAKKKVLPNAKKEETKTVAKESRGSSQQKKRWMFVVLGLLFGWMGAHYIYARRWGLFALHVAAFVGLLIVPPLGLLWLATWFGGVFFVKKDGSKRRML